ncbi:hypothetical protein KKG72_11940 [bacterium]|nr:hypothetical protein [bacterium]MBU1994828.1 hypothetical protein [bacterium]
MNKLKSLVLQTAAVSLAVFGMSGCSALQEGFASQMEVPTLENQANRVAVGMTIVRENNIMVFKMPISADAKWPAIVSADLNETQKEFIDKTLKDDPYFATAHYSKLIQRNMLGSGALMNQLGDYGNMAAMVLDQSVSPLTYRAIQKLDAFYKNKDLKSREEYPSEEAYLSDAKKYWPNIFNYDSSLDNFLEFKDGTMTDIESPTGDVYQNLGEAVISLAPINMQKDLSVANLDMLDAYVSVASIQGEKGELDTKLKADMAHSEKQNDEGGNYTPLTAQEKLEIENDLVVIEERIKGAESIAEEKEAIYFNLLDQAVVALESDMNIDNESYVKLAKNVNIVANEVQAGSTEAYASFGLAFSNIAANNIVLKFPTELKSLAISKANVPMHLQSKYDARIARLVKNSVYLLPNIFIGTYYAHKQSILAEKYGKVTEMIMLAYEAKMEQNAAAAEAEKVAIEENQKKNS